MMFLLDSSILHNDGDDIVSDNDDVSYLCPDEAARCRLHLDMRNKCNQSDSTAAAAVHPAKQLH